MNAAVRERAPAAALVVLAAGYAAWQLASLPAAPVLEVDSPGYLAFSPFRTAAYPLVLRWFGPDLTVFVQPLLYALSALLLALATRAVGGRALPALALLAAVLINPELNRLHAAVMTESLYASTLLLVLAAVLVFFRWPGWQAALVVGLLAGLAAAVRPAAYALAPVLVLMVLMTRGRWRGPATLVFAAALVPMLLVVAAERLYTRSVQGPGATSLAGRHLYAKGALLEAPAPAAAAADPVQRALVAAAAEQFAPIRALLAQAPDADVRSVLSINYETCLEYDCVSALRAGLRLPEPVLNEAAFAVGLGRISAAPGAYLRLLWRNYRAAWVLYSQSHPDLAPRFRDFVQGHRPLPYESAVPTLVADFQDRRAALILRPAMIALGLATGLLALVGLGLALRGGVADPLLGTGVTAALAVHLTLLWTAAVGVGIARYTIGLWPLIAAAGVLAAAARLHPRTRTRAHAP